MGLIVLFFSYIVMALPVLILTPLLYVWVTKKLIVFENTSYKEYMYFWVLLVLLSSILQVIHTAILQVMYGSEEAFTVYVSTYSSIGFFLNFGLMVVLAKWVFRTSFMQAFKASIVYIVIYAIVISIITFISLYFGLKYFTGT